MTTCSLCGSLDFTQLFSEESRQLSSLSQDISDLYEENSSFIAKIKTLNLELEEFDNPTNSYDDTQNVENFRDEKALWRAREDMLRTTLAQQLSNLCQDVHHHQPQHRAHRPHVPRQLWGHSTQRWQ